MKPARRGAARVSEGGIGHHPEWLLACEAGQPMTCPFRYSGPPTESNLLGNLASRPGKRLEWARPV